MWGRHTKLFRSYEQQRARVNVAAKRVGSANAQDVRRLIYTMVGVLAGVAAGMDGLLWTRSHLWVTAPVRVVLAYVWARTFYLHLQYWQSKHESNIPTQQDVSFPLVRNDRNFQPIASEDVLQFFERRAKRGEIAFSTWPVREVDPRILNFVSSLVRPSFSRRRCRERVTIERRVTKHQVWMTIDESAIFKLSKFNVVAVARPDKQTRINDLTVSVAGGRILPTLGAMDSAAICYQLLRYFLSGEELSANISSKLNSEAVDMMLGGRKSKKEVVEFLNRVQLARPELSKSDASLFLDLCRLLSGRRIYFAMIPDGFEPELGQIEVAYTQRTEFYEYEILRGKDWWRNLKTECRRLFGGATRTVDLPIGLARSSQHYALQVLAPKGCFFGSSRVWARAGDPKKTVWLDSLKADALYTSYIHWSEPTGEQYSAATARDLAETDFHQLHYRLQINEVPSGTLGLASSLSLAVTLSIWLAGVVESSDIVATIAAGLGILSSWLILGTNKVDNAYRSLTGLVSLGVSTILGIATVVLYIGQHSDGNDGHFPELNFPAGKTIFWISDGSWLILLLLSTFNYLITWGTLAMRWVSYRRMSADSEITSTPSRP